MSNNRGVILQGRARQIIYNIHKMFEHEKHRATELLRDLNLAKIHVTPNGIPISHQLFDELTEFLKGSVRVTERVVLSTGVNKNTVTRIKREGTEAAEAGTYNICTPVRKPRGKSLVLDNCDLYALSKLITRLYLADNDIPSINKIHAKARSDLNFQGSVTTLRRILIGQLGYKITKSGNQSKQITIIRPSNAGSNSSDENIETEFLENDIEMTKQDDNINTIND